MPNSFEFNGTGGIIEGNLGAANVNVNLDPVYGNFATNTVLSSSHSDFDNIFTTSGDATSCISAWIYPTATSAGRIIAKNWHLQIREESGGGFKVRFASQHATTNGVWTTSGTFLRPVKLNAWNHIAVTYEEDSVGYNPFIYVNGVKYGVGESSGFTLNEDATPDGARDDSSVDLTIGNNGSNSMVGYIMDVKIYDSNNVTPEQVNIMSSKINVEPDVIGASGLLAWYKLNASATADSGGNSRTLSASNIGSVVYDAFSVDVYDNSTTTDGTFTVTQGKVEGLALTSVDFDGSNDYINIGDANSFSFGDGSNDEAFSISAWINMDDATSFPIISKGVYNTNAEWNFKTESDDKLYLILYDESVSSTQEYACTTATLTAHQDKWIHVTATYNGVGGTSANAGIKLYVNGVAEAMTLGDAGTYVAMENLAASIHIGRYDSQYANGSIRDVRIYGQELSADQVASLYSNTLLQTPQQHFELNQAASPFADTGTSSAGQGYQNGGATVVNGTLDLDGDVTIAANGTLSAPRGNIEFSTAGTTNTWDDNSTNGFIGNGGSLVFVGGGNKDFYGNGGTGYANIVSDGSNSNIRWREDATCTGITINSGGFLTPKGDNFTITCTGNIVNNGTWKFSDNSSNGITVAGSSATSPAVCSGNEWNFNSENSASICLLKDLDFQFNITTGNATGTGAITIRLTGDCEFDAVTVSSGDTLDLNGQRAELSGVLSVPSGGTLDADGLIFASNIDMDSSTPTNITSCDAVLTGSGTVDNENSTGLFNTLMFNGTGKFQPNNGHMLSATNVIICNEVDCNDVAQTGPVNITVPTGGTLDGDSATLTVAGDFTTSGGLIGKSGLNFDGSNDYVTCGSHSSIDDIFDNGGTAEFWIKPESGGEGNFGRIADKGQWVFHLKDEASGFVKLNFTHTFSTTTGDWFTTNRVIPLNKWSHVAVTYDGSNVNNDPIIYVDGKSVPLTEDSTPAGSYSSDSSSDLIIGNKSDGSRTFDGVIDMARIFDDVRTQSEIRADMFNEHANMANTGNLVGMWQFDEGTGTTVDNVANSGVAAGSLVNSPAFAGSGTFTYGTSTLVMAKSGTQTINYLQNEQINNLTINDGSTTQLFCLDESGGALRIYGNLVVNEKLKSHASSSSSQIKFKTADKTLTVGSDVKTTALSELFRIYNDTGGVFNFPELTTQRIFINDGTSSATGDLTITQELQVDSGTTFNANTNTIAAKVVDVNAGTLDLRNSTLNFSVTASGDQLALDSSSTLLTGNTNINGNSSASKTNFYAPADGGYEVVGTVKHMDIQTGGDLTVVGSVINCRLTDSTANIRQWHHTLDTQQLLDADEGGDDDLKLPRPSLDNALQLQTGG